MRSKIDEAEGVIAHIREQSFLARPAQMRSDIGWTPRLTFVLDGPVPDGAEIVTRVNNEDGSEWLTLGSNTGELAADSWSNVELVSYEDEHHSTAAGAFPFDVRLVSELDGIDELLWSGTLDVEQVDGAFTIPQGWLFGEARVGLPINEDPDAPRLRCTFWMPGGTEAYEHGAYLFYNGARVTSTESAGDLSSGLEVHRSDGSDGPETALQLVASFDTVRGYVNGSYADQDSWHIMCEHPGDYEIKLAQGTSPIRSVKFSVGGHGRIVPAGWVGWDASTAMTTGYAAEVVKGDAPAATGRAWYGDTRDFLDYGIDSMYSQWQQPEGDTGEAAPEVDPEVESAVGNAENVVNWYWDDLHKDPIESDTLLGMEVNADGLATKLDGLVAAHGAATPGTLHGAASTLGAVAAKIQEMRGLAAAASGAAADATEAQLAPYRALLKNDKLRVFEDHPAPDYRYYTLKKKEIETPEELAEAEWWFFEGSTDQGLITEQWTVKGWKFDADGNEVDSVDKSDHGTNAPSKAFGPDD